MVWDLQRVSLSDRFASQRGELIMDLKNLVKLVSVITLISTFLIAVFVLFLTPEGIQEHKIAMGVILGWLSNMSVIIIMGYGNEWNKGDAKSDGIEL